MSHRLIISQLLNCQPYLVPWLLSNKETFIIFLCCYCNTRENMPYLLDKNRFVCISCLKDSQKENAGFTSYIFKKDRIRYFCKNHFPPMQICTGNSINKKRFKECDYMREQESHVRLVDLCCFKSWIKQEEPTTVIFSTTEQTKKQFVMEFYRKVFEINKRESV